MDYYSVLRIIVGIIAFFGIIAGMAFGYMVFVITSIISIIALFVLRQVQKKYPAKKEFTWLKKTLIFSAISGIVNAILYQLTIPELYSFSNFSVLQVAYVIMPLVQALTTALIAGALTGIIGKDIITRKGILVTLLFINMISITSTVIMTQAYQLSVTLVFNKIVYNTGVGIAAWCVMVLSQKALALTSSKNTTTP